MTSPWTARWHGLKKGRPGHRFQDRYDRSRRRPRGSVWGSVARYLLAGASFLIGFVLMFMPGPAILFYFIGASLLAAESRTVARWLDRGELRSWAAWRAAKRGWRRCGTAARAVVMAGLGACILGIGYMSWWLMFG